MKKAFLLLLGFISAVAVGYAQNSTVTVTTTDKGAPEPPKVANRLIYFDGYQNSSAFDMETTLMGVMDTRVYEIFTQIEGPPNLNAWNKAHPESFIHKFIPKTSIILGVKRSASANVSIYHTSSLSKDFIAYKLADKDSVTAIAMGINADNVNNYRYHVVENDSTELVTWRVPALQQQYGAKKAYGFLGKFNAPGKEITVEVVNVKNYSIRDGAVFNWRNNLKPIISRIQVFDKPWKKTEMFIVSPTNITKYASKFDKITGAPLDFHFWADSVVSFNIGFKSHPTMGYDIYWVFNDGPQEYKNLIVSNLRDSVYGVTPQYFPDGGKRVLLIYPTGTTNKNQETRIEYHVYPDYSPEKFSIEQLLPYVIGAFILFIIYYIYNRRRLRKLDQQKEMANLKLGSVRAQLNPHFMFNALTSIQNLMNQQDSAGANHYLAKFADLTRQVLGATGTELISLEDELKIVRDYLEIEQLRFGFQYTVEVHKGINIANTEIPGMLMQPFIENAAKHGISGMLTKGKINITIEKKQNNLVFTIADNGKGFDSQSAGTSGFGLKLGRERIALLNQIYKNQPIELQINSGHTGTTIIITLTAWF
ncbi:sensor histidine kinase [Mucilaginibacter sp. UR6-11]|uniref:sensor histidine kinase n=1 Tax=Mucilaginibacter sp. UR6-11 TaxID=1435644 RepID=UPI001E5F8472|nr:histidine kinase [Mucilaginibacter sp. UR6-11]MCC8424467.1 histidine kinase [Mucilaginibacter sp. UR6-11]